MQKPLFNWYLSVRHSTVNLLIRVIPTELEEAAEQACRLRLAPDFVMERGQGLTSPNHLPDTKWNSQFDDITNRFNQQNFIIWRFRPYKLGKAQGFTEITIAVSVGQSRDLHWRCWRQGCCFFPRGSAHTASWGKAHSQEKPPVAGEHAGVVGEGCCN